MKKINRLGIFFFWDQDGKADEYIFYLLNHIRPFLKELCCVINGRINKSSYKNFLLQCNKVIIRENEGLDATAYKCALKSYGYQKLAEYDEVICFNFTVYGPLFDISPIFKSMELRNCDWWSLYKTEMFEPNVPGEHLPSFFIAYRQSLLRSNAFKEYWETLPNILSYGDSVQFHEQRQTPFFDRHGYKREVYFDFSKYDLEYRNEYWPLVKADKMIIDDHFPFLKRRNLYITNSDFNFALANNLIPFIKKETVYPIKYVYTNLKRTQDISSLDAIPNSSMALMIKKCLSKIAPSKRIRRKYKEELLNIRSVCFNKLFN